MKKDISGSWFASYLGIRKFESNGRINFYHINIDVDVEILKNSYQEFIFNGVNKNKDRKDITIYTIFTNLFNKELNTSIEFKKFLDSSGCSYDDFKNIDNEYRQFILKCEFDLLLNNKSRIFYRNTLIIHNKIKELLKEDNSIIKSDVDIEKISLLLSLINSNTFNAIIKEFLIKHGLTIHNIVNYCNIGEIENFLVNDRNLRETEIDYELFFSNYKKYLNDSYLDVIKNIILNESDDHSIIRNIVLNNNGNYRILKIEVENEEEYQPTLSERIMELASEKVENIDLDNINSILNFGNFLTHHSRYIHDEIPKLLMGESNEESINTINNLIDKTYVNSVQKKKTFFERLFGIDDQTESRFNPEVIGELKDSIDSNISVLSKELLVYDSIRKYIEVYQTKNKYHLDVIRNSIEFLENSLKEINTSDDDKYFHYLNTSSHLQIMREKEKRFVTSSALMRQELFKINQTMVNHFITINSLEMARDDLIPLVGAELAIGLGRETENQGLDLSQNIMELFRAILTRNINGTEENLKKLKEIGLSDETFTLINKDISGYISGLEQMNVLTSSIEKYDDTKIKKLTLM